MNQKKKIILASGSEIRRKIMHDVGLDFSVRVGDTDEGQLKTEFLNTKLPNGRTPSETRFNRLDSNNDNHITQDEFDAMKSKRSNRNRD